MNFCQFVGEELARLQSGAVLGWENKSLTLFGETIEVPHLNVDNDVISKFRIGSLS